MKVSRIKNLLEGEGYEKVVFREVIEKQYLFHAFSKMKETIVIYDEKFRSISNELRK